MLEIKKSVLRKIKSNNSGYLTVEEHEILEDILEEHLEGECIRQQVHSNEQARGKTCKPLVLKVKSPYKIGQTMYRVKKEIVTDDRGIPRDASEIIEREIVLVRIEIGRNFIRITPYTAEMVADGWLDDWSDYTINALQSTNKEVFEKVYKDYHDPSNLLSRNLHKAQKLMGQPLIAEYKLTLPWFITEEIAVNGDKDFITGYVVDITKDFCSIAGLGLMKHGFYKEGSATIDKGSRQERFPEKQILEKDTKWAIPLEVTPISGDLHSMNLF